MNIPGSSSSSDQSSSSSSTVSVAGRRRRVIGGDGSSEESPVPGRVEVVAGRDESDIFGYPNENHCGPYMSVSRYSHVRSSVRIAPQLECLPSFRGRRPGVLGDFATTPTSRVATGSCEPSVLSLRAVRIRDSRSDHRSDDFGRIPLNPQRDRCRSDSPIARSLLYS